MRVITRVPRKSMQSCMHYKELPITNSIPSEKSLKDEGEEKTPADRTGAASSAPGLKEI